MTGSTSPERGKTQEPPATVRSRTTSFCAICSPKCGTSRVSVTGATRVEKVRSSQPLGAGLISFSVTSALPFDVNTRASNASASAHSGRSGCVLRSGSMLTTSPRKAKKSEQRKNVYFTGRSKLGAKSELGRRAAKAASAISATSQSQRAGSRDQSSGIEPWACDHAAF